MPRMSWEPDGLRDVKTKPAPVSDPEASLYSHYTRWVLVKTAEALHTNTDWDQHTLAVICIEALCDNTSYYEWQDRVGHALYVERAQVQDFQEGEVAYNKRFVLRDLAWKLSRKYLD